jgi:N-acetylmuramoyl-L-alanine amidase
MKRKLGIPSTRIRSLRPPVVTALLLLSLVPAAQSQQKKAAARAQFERAEKMRAGLEGRPQEERTLKGYQSLVEAYRRVYLTTPQAPEVTPALVAVAELYHEMGRQFDPKYFLDSIRTYQFLLSEYPGSRYRADALFTIGQIQQEDLNQLASARTTFEEFLRRFPDSPKAEDARRMLEEIADASKKEESPASSRKQAELRAQDLSLPQVTNIRTWNAENSTRIVVDLERTVKFQSARIKSPDRIYFDLAQARLSPTLAGKTLDLKNGFLKAIRVAQNQKGVVRLVLDVDRVKDYSAFLLPNPYRLVIDVRGQATTTAKSQTSRTARAESADKSAEKPAENSQKTEVASGENPSPGPVETLPTHKPVRTGHEAAEPSAPSSSPKPTRDGQQSLTRTLGLKISRIVIDAGHGGHDTGTIGPRGVMEKDVCLDVALRLGKLIEKRLAGAEVVYTRQDDTFVPLETRTAIANQSKADLFISIHANASRDSSARGVETYYLNFATSEEAMQVAARENALSQSSIHELQDLIKKIARNEKVEESKELASDIQDSLAKRLQQTSLAQKDRGVKKAPFVVLIGANMPSALAEISFLSNPSDERLLRKSDQRERVAEGLFRGVESYLDSLNSLTENRQKLISSSPSSP